MHARHLGGAAPPPSSSSSSRGGVIVGRAPPRLRTARRKMAAAHAAASSAASSTATTAVDDAMLELAHELADAAGRITTKYFRARGAFAVESKADASPVTIADREAEDAMRKLITAAFPSHAIFGEERGLSRGSGGNGGSGGPRYMWVLDPIDGTKSFVTGKPLFGTLIALLADGTPILGVLDQPVTRERWVGALGARTTLNGAPLRTRSCGALGDAFSYSTTPHMFAPGAVRDAWRRVRDAVRTPLYGCDCYAYGLLAAGCVDVVVEADLKPYDYLALVPIVQGAGGVITDWRGDALTWRASDDEIAAGAGAPPGEVLAAGDARAHVAALELLAWGK